MSTAARGVEAAGSALPWLDAPGPPPLTPPELRAIRTIRLLGTVGALFLAVGSVGAGALPADNPGMSIPVARLFTRIPTVSLAIAISGMVLLVVAWLLYGRYARPKRPRMATPTQTTRTAVMWITPLMVAAPLFSRDVYSYLAQSEIVYRGMDPYSLGPADALGRGRDLTRSVDLVWWDTPAPYGPLFLEVGSWMSGIAGNHVPLGVLLQRCIALVGVALIIWSLPRLARRFGVEPTTALWLGAANPLLIFHLVAGAHNEAIGIGLMMAGLEVGLRRLPVRVAGDSPPPLAPGELTYLVSGAVLLTLAAAVKINAALALGFFGVMIARRWHGRVVDLLRAAAGLAVVFAAVLVAVSVSPGLGVGWMLPIGVAGLLAALRWGHLLADRPWLAAGLTLAFLTTLIAVGFGSGLGFGWVGALGTPGLVRTLISPVTLLGYLTAGLGIWLDLGVHTHAITDLLSVLGLIISGIITVLLLWRCFRWQLRPIIGLGVAMGVVLGLHVSLHPWWMLWAVIPLAASAGTSRFRVAATIGSATLALVILPTGSTFQGREFVLWQTWVAAIVVGAAALLIVRRSVPLWRDPSTGTTPSPAKF